MTTRHLEVLVEEESMEALLDSLLPRLAPGVSFAIRRFQGKHDLLQKLPQRMGGLPKDAAARMEDHRRGGSRQRRLPHAEAAPRTRCRSRWSAYTDGRGHRLLGSGEPNRHRGTGSVVLRRLVGSPSCVSTPGCQHPTAEQFSQSREHPGRHMGGRCKRRCRLRARCLASRMFPALLLPGERCVSRPGGSGILVRCGCDGKGAGLRGRRGRRAVAWRSRG